MEIRNVITFVKAAEMQSFTKTASQLGYSQAAVTVQIRQLEEELGTQLFDRIGRSVKLTHAGERFMPYALRLLQAMDSATTFMKNEDEPSGKLRIGASSSFSAGMIPKIISRFSDMYPKIDVVVRTSDLTESTYELLRQNELDFIFTLERKYQPADCVRVAERQEEIVFVTYPENSIAKEKNVTLERILEERFVSSDREVSYGNYLEQVIRERGYTFRPMIEIGSTSAIINILKEGVGVSYLPRFLIDEPMANGDLAIIDAEDLGVQAWTQMLRLKNKWVNPEMKAFMDFMVENLESL